MLLVDKIHGSGLISTPSPTLSPPPPQYFLSTTKTGNLLCDLFKACNNSLETSSVLSPVTLVTPAPPGGDSDIFQDNGEPDEPNHPRPQRSRRFSSSSSEEEIPRQSRGRAMPAPSTSNNAEKTDCASPTLQDSKYSHTPRPFLRTGSNSKYLYPESGFMLKPNSAKEICHELNLEVATVTTVYDFKHLVEFFHEKNLAETTTSNVFSMVLEGSTVNESGMFRLPSGELLPFQMFNLKKFHCFEDQSDCLAIQCEKHDTNECYFKPKICGDTTLLHQEVMPLCQFRRGSACFNKTILAVMEATEKDELFFIKANSKGKFYGSRKQVKINFLQIYLINHNTRLCYKEGIL